MRSLIRNKFSSIGCLISVVLGLGWPKKPQKQICIKSTLQWQKSKSTRGENGRSLELEFKWVVDRCNDTHAV